MRALLAASLAAMLFVAACGTDGSGPEALASVQSQDDSSDSTDPADDLDRADDVSELAPLGGCEAFRSVYTGVIFAGFAALLGDDEGMAEVQSQLDELGVEGPADIADELDTVADSYGQFFERFRAMLGDDEGMAEVQSQLDEMGANFPADLADGPSVDGTYVPESYEPFIEAIGDGGVFGVAGIPLPEDDPDVVEAADAVADWFVDNCEGSG